MNKLIFNAQLQRETEYALQVDDNNDIVATCTESGDQLKFPNVSEAEFDVLIAKHKQANEGQIIRKPLFNGELELNEQPVEVTPADPQPIS